MDKNKELAELLGIEWHEMHMIYQCSCGICFDDDVNDLREHILRCNPDFTTPEGIVSLLGIMKNQEDWVGFIEKVGMIHYPAYSQSRGRETIYYLEADYFLDTTGKLRDAAIDFLKGKTNG